MHYAEVLSHIRLGNQIVLPLHTGSHHPPALCSFLAEQIFLHCLYLMYICHLNTNNRICQQKTFRIKKLLSFCEKHLTFCRGHDTVCAMVKSFDEDGQILAFSESRRLVKAGSAGSKYPSLPSRSAERFFSKLSRMPALKDKTYRSRKWRRKPQFEWYRG